MRAFTRAGSPCAVPLRALHMHPNDKAVYGVDGNMGNALGETFDAGT